MVSQNSYLIFTVLDMTVDINYKLWEGHFYILLFFGINQIIINYLYLEYVIEND